MASRSYLPRLVSGLRSGIRMFPRDFYDTFKYTMTGRNLTHPWTIGLLTRILWSFRETAQVGIDVRMNSGGAKFQPDLVAYAADGNPVLFVDYESPNSSDARIIEKDVKPYIRWTRNSGIEAEYVIITTLPARPCPQWELRYTAKGQCNSTFRKDLERIRKCPFQFWYSRYRSDLRGAQSRLLHFVNIDGRRVVTVAMPDRG